MSKITISLFFIAAFITSPMAQAQVVINEILTSNATINADEDGSYEDWVELYNAGTTAVNLGGFGLTDDASVPFKWVFPAVTLPANSYLLVFCSDKDRAIAGQPLHTNFRISAGGETITLTAPDNSVADASPAVALLQDISYGRLPNGTGSWLFFENVTPAAPNAAQGFNEVLPPPVFSQNGGFSTAAFTLNITSPVAGATILYTLDGSDPNPAHIGGKTYNYKNQYPRVPGQPFGPMLTQSIETLTYNGPISIVDRSTQPNEIANISSTWDFTPTYIPEDPIFKGTVVKAMLVKEGALPSRVVTQTYFVTPQGSDRFTFPVVSVSVDEDKLYDYEDGIYTAGIDFDQWRVQNPDLDPMYLDAGNFHREGAESERKAHISYFVGGQEVLNQNIGIRVKGGSSRDFPSKSLNLFARNNYGANRINYPIFSDLPNDDYERLQLRNSGGDFYATMFRDAYNQELCKNLRNIERQSYQPTVVFMNGEYWGVLNFREKYDDEYFAQMLDIDEVDLLENEMSDPEAEAGDEVDWMQLYSYMLANSLAGDENYQYIQTRIDTENFMDYYIANIFMDNGDWPGYNTVYWRKKTQGYVPGALYGHDGRWRWAFHDMDDTFGITSDNFTRNSLAAATATDGPEWPNPPSSTLFLRRFLENNTFKNDFINRFADLMNTTFLPTRMVNLLVAMNEAIDQEMPEHIDRWKAPLTLDSRTWYLNFQTNFINNRPTVQRNHIRSKFNIASNINITLDVSHTDRGFVHINTIDVKDGTPGIEGNPYPWTGIYFSNIPVKVKAVALPGYAFSHWSGASNSTEEEITMTMASSFALTAHFIEAAPVAETVPLYFWMMDTNIPNDTPLESLAATYELTADASISYQSCLAGYPFTSANPNWRKASMERRNSPTDLNYLPQANQNIPFATSNMRGLQVTQPFQNAGLENTMVFNIPSTNYKDIKFSFAAKDENAADALLIDYSTNGGAPQWSSAGITSTLPLSDTYQLYTVDLSSVAAANDNPNLKIRIRFAGTDMTADLGNRVTFNNFSVIGTEISLETPSVQADLFAVYPNPVRDVLNLSLTSENNYFRLYTIDGKLVQEGPLMQPSLDMSALNSGIYLLELAAGDRSQTKKIIKL